MKVVIRKFRAADVIKASNAVKAAQRITLKDYYPKKVIEAYCEKNNPKNFLERAKNRQFYVAEVGKKIVGVIALASNELKTFYVHPKYQGKGVGRLLYERIKREAVKKGYRGVIVLSSVYAEPIYKSLGFTKVKRKYESVCGSRFAVILMQNEF
jgi:N-acetylglutamate synthase-like GNAT family acetyltransferase